MSLRVRCKKFFFFQFHVWRHFAISNIWFGKSLHHWRRPAGLVVWLTWLLKMSSKQVSRLYIKRINQSSDKSIESINPSMASFRVLSLADVLAALLTTCLPWHLPPIRVSRSASKNVTIIDGRPVASLWRLLLTDSDRSQCDSCVLHKPGDCHPLLLGQAIEKHLSYSLCTVPVCMMRVRTATATKWSGHRWRLSMTWPENWFFRICRL